MRIAAALMLLALAACETTGAAPGAVGPISHAANRPYAQAVSGMVFPSHVNDFQRVSLTRFNAEGTDESAGYNYNLRQGSGIVVTVYIYPSPTITSIGSPRNVVEEARNRLCAQQFAGAQAEIAGAYSDAQSISVTEARLSQSGVVHVGRSASYNFTSPNFGGSANTPVRSELHQFCYVGGRWSLKYRITYPANFDARALVDAFMRDLVWTIPPEGRTAT